jgi:Asp-tRNA(Asn)/Glu-tRNA(Gln) amidotransferase A subunit family amidase
MNSAPATALDRRRFLGFCSALGLSGTLFPGALFAMAQDQAKPDEKLKITHQMIDDAAALAGVSIADDYKDMMVEGLNDQLADFKAIRELHIPNSVAPADRFDPVLPGMNIAIAKHPMRLSRADVSVAPKNLEDLAFASVRELAELVRTKRVSSTALTQMYLDRLKRYDRLLHYDITPLEDRALSQAKDADREIAAGKYRGPLHGIPWGAKDLLAVQGFRTTWGAGGFENQEINQTATVVERLDKAGAVLIAKLTLGALAMGDKWFGGMTRNPWRPQQGSSGSSAGSSSATAAGCIAFGIGSETLGSISSPSTRNGATGLRPTFGRVPRTGAMALSWSMDKLGPICRFAEDCAIVLEAIYGPDGHDATVHDYPFSWDAALDIRKLRIGYVKASFERPFKAAEDAKPEQVEPARRRFDMARKFDEAALDVMRNKLGINLVPVELPEKIPWGSMLSCLSVEAAAAFDELTRTGRDKLLTQQTKDDWPNQFRTARFIPGVDYVNAMRARTMGMEQFAKAIEGVDVFIVPTNDSQLVMTNLTGHPAVILPNGFRPADTPAPKDESNGGGPNTPVSITFIGQLYQEEKLLAIAKAYQDATGFHLKHPPLDEELKTVKG